MMCPGAPVNFFPYCSTEATNPLVMQNLQRPGLQKHAINTYNKAVDVATLPNFHITLTHPVLDV